MAVLKYYNTTTSAWEYIAASTTANFTTWKKTMSGGETSVSGTDDNAVTLSYTVGLEQVFINGVLQVRGADYVATTGTSVTGLTALVASDIVTVVCYAPFNVANTIAPTVVDAKGDLLAGTAADTVGRLAVGTNNQLLAADSSTATGLKWANPGLTLISTTSFSAVSSVSIDSVFSATYDNYKVYLNITSFTASPSITIRMRASGTNNSSSNYRYAGVRVNAATGTVDGINSGASDTSWGLLGSGTGGTSIFASLEFLQPFATARTSYSTNAFPQGGYNYQGNGRMTVDTSYDGVSFISDDNNIAGNINVYGYNK